MFRRFWHGNCNTNDMKRLAAINIVLVALYMSAAHAADVWGNTPDPTRPVFARPGAAVGGLELQTTVISSGRKLAVIGGRTVQVGATIADFVVTDIRPYEVDLKSATGARTLRLLPLAKTQVKTTSPTIIKNKAETLSKAP